MNSWERLGLPYFLPTLATRRSSLLCQQTGPSRQAVLGMGGDDDDTMRSVVGRPFLMYRYRDGDVGRDR